MSTRLINAVKWRYRDFQLNVSIFTLQSLLKYYIFLLLNRDIIKVKVKKIRNKITIRVKNRIDRDVISYVFFLKYHLPPKEKKLSKKPTIIDLGSNIGCTLLDLNYKFPDADIYGFEMDPNNFHLAKLNCSKYKNIHLNNVAIWNKKGIAYYSSKNASDAYSIQNLSKNSNDNKINTITISDIMRRNKLKVVDYLKMDIEGAEIEIFNNNNLDWLDNVLSLNIEFHNIPSSLLNKYITLLKSKGFEAYKSPKHWLSVLAFKNNTHL